MQKATMMVVGTFSPSYEKFFEDYSSKVRRFLELKGATVIRRQVIEKTLYGKGSPSLVMVIDFPTKESAEVAFFEQQYWHLFAFTRNSHPVEDWIRLLKSRLARSPFASSQ